FLEYNRYSPDFSFRIMPLLEQLICQDRVIIALMKRCALFLAVYSGVLAAEDSARAILENRCLNCHGQAQTSGLDLRQPDTIAEGGKRGPAIVPGSAEQ